MIGPRSRARGSARPSTWRPTSASASRVCAPGSRRRTRRAAILAISPGWKEQRPQPIQIREPLTFCPDRQQRQQQQRQTGDHRGVGVALQPPVVAHHADHQRGTPRRRWSSRPADRAQRVAAGRVRVCRSRGPAGGSSPGPGRRAGSAIGSSTGSAYGAFQRSGQVHGADEHHQAGAVGRACSAAAAPCLRQADVGVRERARCRSRTPAAPSSTPRRVRGGRAVARARHRSRGRRSGRRRVSASASARSSSAVRRRGVGSRRGGAASDPRACGRRSASSAWCACRELCCAAA